MSLQKFRMSSLADKHAKAEVVSVKVKKVEKKSKESKEVKKKK